MRRISQLKARTEVGGLLGISQSTLRNWIKREGKDPALSVVSSTPTGGEVARLKRADEILRTASAFFDAAELDRRLGQ